jgi:epoxyqueuosine reductase
MSNTMMITQKIYQELEVMGYKVRSVNAKRIPDLQKDIRVRHEQNLIFPKLYEDYRSYFEFTPSVKFKKIESLIIIAIPVPQYRAVFNWNQKEIPLLIPPTYLYGFDIVNQMRDFFKEILKPEGYNAAYAQIPQKTLAVRSGLAEYGRNNITYVSGMGSFYRLATFYTDIPITEDNWHDLKMMDLCKTCSACICKCPTGAIPKAETDRFLLLAGKCLTYHNEQSGNIPFPEWIESSWHNCLVGCLHCQKVCPANKEVKDWVESGPQFTEQETELLLKKQNIDKLPTSLKNKLEEYDFTNYLEVFPRNLGVFLK